MPDNTPPPSTGSPAIAAHPLVASLNADAGPNQGVVSIEGFFGPSKKAECERLYLDLSFQRFLDIPRDGIVDVKKVDSDDANSATRVLIKASVKIDFGTSVQIEASFLNGNITAKHLSGASASPAAAGNPVVEGTGFTTSSTYGCCTIFNPLCNAAAAAAAGAGNPGVAGTGGFTCSYGICSFSCREAAAAAGAGNPGVAGTGGFMCSYGICSFSCREAAAAAAAAAAGAGNPGVAGTGGFMCSYGICSFSCREAAAAAAAAGAGNPGVAGNTVWHMTVPFCTLGPGCH